VGIFLKIVFKRDKNTKISRHCADGAVHGVQKQEKSMAAAMVMVAGGVNLPEHTKEVVTAPCLAAPSTTLYVTHRCLHAPPGTPASSFSLV